MAVDLRPIGPVPSTPPAGTRWQLYTGVKMFADADLVLATGASFTLNIPAPGGHDALTGPAALTPNQIFLPSNPTAAVSFAGILQSAQFRLWVNYAPQALVAVKPDAPSGFTYGVVALGDLWWEQHPSYVDAYGVPSEIFPLLKLQWTVSLHVDVVLHATVTEMIGDWWIAIPLGGGLPPDTSPPDTLSLRPPAFQIEWPRHEFRGDFVTHQLGDIGSLTGDRMRWTNRRYIVWGDHETWSAEQGATPTLHYDRVLTFAKIPGLDDAGAPIYGVWDTSTWDNAVWGP